MKYACMVILSVGLCSLATAQNQKAPSQPLKLVQTIPLPGVEGRIDHMNVDVRGKRYILVRARAQSSLRCRAPQLRPDREGAHL